MCMTCESKAAGRRDFLKFVGAGVAGMTLAAAMRPVRAA